MYSLIFYFVNRKITVELWNSAKIDQIETHNGARDLVSLIDGLLRSNNLELANVSKIGLLNGPGSFTSIRIVCATVMGLSTGRDIQVYPFRLDQLITGEILLEIGKRLYYVYDAEWQVVRTLKREYRQIPWSTVGTAIRNQMHGIPEKLAPFYLSLPAENY